MEFGFIDFLTLCTKCTCGPGAISDDLLNPLKHLWYDIFNLRIPFWGTYDSHLEVGGMETTEIWAELVLEMWNFWQI